MTKDKKTLKQSSHQLKPVVIIGANGLTDAVQKEIDLALEAHELIKIRVNAQDDEQRLDMVNAILVQHGASLINQIGHVVVIYRPASQDKD